jgi:hypothetical protein
VKALCGQDVGFVKVKPRGSFNNRSALEGWPCIALGWFIIESGRGKSVLELSIFSLQFATQLIVFEKRLFSDIMLISSTF